MPKVVVGFVIESEEPGWFLNRDKWWRNHKRPESAYVHPKSILQELRDLGPDWGWEGKPAKVYPALWKEGYGITVTGQPLAFEW